MSEIFDETNMRRILGKHIPEGETLLAGIHGISQEVQIKRHFWKVHPYRRQADSG